MRLFCRALPHLFAVLGHHTHLPILCTVINADGRPHTGHCGGRCWWLAGNIGASDGYKAPDWRGSTAPLSGWVVLKATKCSVRYGAAILFLGQNNLPRLSCHYLPLIITRLSFCVCRYFGPPVQATGKMEGIVQMGWLGALQAFAHRSGFHLPPNRRRHENQIRL